MKLYFGMAQWQHPAWVGWLLLQKSPSHRLSDYAKYFNTVEVGSSFYADLTQQQIARWYEQVPDDFHFVFKLPQTITHHLSESNFAACCERLTRFCSLLEPFVDKLGATMMQFPSTLTPASLDLVQELCHTWSLPSPLSIEVRHIDFFDRQQNEASLLRMLADSNVNKVIMDSRPVFSTEPYCESLVEAQKKKPKVPCHPILTGQHPVVRFIGHPDLEKNDKYLDQWASKLVEWMQVGATPYVFVHSSDNVAAPLLASSLEQRVVELMSDYRPCLDLPIPQQQTSLF